MRNDIPLQLTYDDVLLEPRRSRVRHRGNVDTTTYLTDKIKLALPFISANMDTVTESAMAIAMARAGGIGIIHRFMTIENQAREVDRVIRDEEFLITNPYTIDKNKTLKDIVDAVEKNEVSSFLVVDKNKKLLGLITNRDFMFETKLGTPVIKLMTPLSRLITASPKVTKEQAKKLFIKHKIEKLPIIDRKGILQSLVTAGSIVSSQNNPDASKDRRGRLICGGAVGVVGDYLERAGTLLDAGASVIVVDVAHGQNISSLEAIKKLRTNFRKAQIIGGNVATASGVRDLISVGVDAVKVGIGPGGLCTTRTVTGVGVPQLSAIINCAKAAGKRVRIIADGGTNYPGDITKALAAGASSIMLAGWFAGTEESPGEIILRKNKRYKIHRGSASFLSQSDTVERLKTGKRLNSIVPEGVESLMEFKGSVAEIIYQLKGSLRSGMSYCDAMTIVELQKNARFIRMTSAGFRESGAHNVDEI
jgi:IMP dehydrogenase